MFYGGRIKACMGNTLVLIRFLFPCEVDLRVSSEYPIHI